MAFDILLWTILCLNLFNIQSGVLAADPLKAVAAYQSGVTWDNHGPEFLIDNNFKTYSASGNNKRHYFIVDFGAQVAVTSVKLYIFKGYEQSLNGFDIAVGNNYRDCVASTIYDQPSCGIVKIESSEIVEVTCQGVGRYVFLRAPNVMADRVLINEIVVFGTVSPNTQTILPASSYETACKLSSASEGNVLLGKKVYNYPDPNGINSATDGDINTVTKTGIKHFAWIAINMEQPQTLNFVRLWPDKYSDTQATTFSVYVTDKFLPCEVNSPEYYSTWKLCRKFENVDLINNLVVDGLCSSSVSGQYLIVVYGTPEDRKAPSRILSFKEIEAFGKPTGQAGISAPQLDLTSGTFDAKKLFPIREAIFGGLGSIVLPKYARESFFVSNSSESILWTQDKKQNIIVATQFGQGRLIIAGIDGIIRNIMSSADYLSVWTAMKTWLGATNSPVKNITDNFVKGDLVLSLGNVKVTADQVAKAITMAKAGEISLIFAPEYSSSFDTRAEYEICRAANVLLSTSLVNYDAVTLTLPAKDQPDVCGLSPEKLLQTAFDIPKVFSLCSKSFASFRTIPAGVLLKLDDVYFRELAMKVVRKYDDFVKFYQPCEANPLKDPVIREFIYGFNQFLLSPFLKNSGYKAPGVSIFPGDIPASAIVREKVTIRFQTISTESPEDSPTGIYLPPGDTLTFTINPIGGSLPENWKITIGCHTDDNYVRDSWIRFPKISLLGNAVLQSIYSPFGGVVWVRGEKANEAVEITFNNAVRGPFFNLRDPNAAQKFDSRKNLPAPIMEAAGDGVILCMPSWTIRDVTGTFMNHVMGDNWDRGIKLGWTIEGSDWRTKRRMRGSPDMQINLGDAHSGYPIGFPLDLPTTMILNETAFTFGDTYYMFHETSHNLQNPEWTWKGFEEVTNNVIAIILQAYLCEGKYANMQRRKLYGDKPIAGVKDYLQNPSYSKLFMPPDFADFDGLGFFNQMGLCYGWGLYQKVFKKFKDENIKPLNDNDARDKMLIALTQVTGYNMSPFFDIWAFPVSASAVAEASKYPCLVPDDLYTQMIPARITSIISKYGSCTRVCPAPLIVTMPDFTIRLDNNVIEL